MAAATRNLTAYRPLVLGALYAMGERHAVHVNRMLVYLDNDSAVGIGALTWSDLLAMVGEAHRMSEVDARRLRGRVSTYGLYDERAVPSMADVARNAVSDDALATLVASEPDTIFALTVNPIEVFTA